MNSYIERVKLPGRSVSRYRGPMQLVVHPGTAIAAVQSIDAAVRNDGERWHFRFSVEGVDDLVLPKPRPARRADGLWRHSCFEAFVALGGEQYVEFNFSPSTQWAAYRFNGYRGDMRPEPAEVEISLEAGEGRLALEAALRCDALSGGAALGLSAVIEEQGGRKSYWSLGHPPGAPDFHERSCFLARLPE